MPELEVSGATLHYQIRGQGPLFLCISGGNGDYEIWQPLAQHLSSRFTVAFYDRRGFSRSHLTGAQDYAHRLETDADDAAALIQHLSPDEPATVLGTSSGAIVALTLLRRHAAHLRLLISHEPPAIALNPNPAELATQQSAIYDLYRAQGIAPAIEKFAELVRSPIAERKGLQASFDGRAGTYRFANALYWFERELLPYPNAALRADMFQSQREKLVTVNARMTDPEAVQFRANETLARELGIELVMLPGGHVGYASHSAEFAKELLVALGERDSFYAQL